MEYKSLDARHSKTAYRALTMSGISFLSAVLGVFFMPFILSPIAMIFSHLSKGRLKSRHFAAQLATVIAILAFILNCVMIGFTVYKLQTDPVARAKVNEMMESMYGVTIEDYTQAVSDEFKILIPETN